MTTTPSPQSSLDRYDGYVLDSFNAARASHFLPPVREVPVREVPSQQQRPNLRLVGDDE